MGSTPEHKHLVLDQRQITGADRYFRVDSDQEALDKALSFLVGEERLSKGLRPLKGDLESRQAAMALPVTGKVVEGQWVSPSQP